MPAYKMNRVVPCSKTVEEFCDSMQMRERCTNVQGRQLEAFFNAKLANHQQEKRFSNIILYLFHILFITSQKSIEQELKLQ